MKFVDNVSTETIKLIIDCVLEDRIINAPEKESILEKSTLRADQARRLLDTVKKKGTKARAMFVSHIERLDPKLHQALWPSAKSGELTVPDTAKSSFAFFSSRNKSVLTTTVVFFLIYPQRWKTRLRSRMPHSCSPQKHSGRRNKTKTM